MVRKKLTPRILTLINMARPRASSDWMGTMTTAKITVLRRDAQKVSLPKRRMKLSKPMKRAGWGEMSRALVKARMNVSTIGTIKKVRISTPAGTSIKKATVPGLRPDRPPRVPAATGLSAGTVGLYVEVVTRCFPSLSGEPQPEPKRSALRSGREAATRRSRWLLGCRRCS